MPGSRQLSDAEAREKLTLRCDQAIVLGDFNFHHEAESALILAPFFDCWRQLHAVLAPTWSGKVNTLTQRMWLGCDAREMRLDRVISTDRADGADGD